MSKKVVVLGAGPGGYAAAFYAADLGMEVTLVDREKNPGGVCLYRGCIPSKAYLHIAKIIDESKEVAHLGVTFAEPQIDIEKIRNFKNSVVTKLTGGLGMLTKQRKINYIQGEAKFKNSDVLSVTSADGSVQDVIYDNIIVATGSRPSVIPGMIESPRIMDSTAALELENVPKTMLVVGGGIIGLELGSVYATLGTKVTVVEFLDGIIPGADKDLVAVLQKKISKKIDSIKVKTKVAKMEEVADGIKVTFEGQHEGEEVFEKILVSVGRKPNTENIGLENTGVQLDRGFIVVNEARRTHDSKIYAIGDVVGNPMLAHKASAEAKIAVEAIEGKKVAFEPKAIPSVVYTDPEVAWAGLTETEAKAKGIEYKLAKFPWAASGRALAIDAPEGFTKLLVDPASEQVLGVAMVGPGAGDMIAEGTLAIEMGATVKDIGLTIHPHPTLSETMMEAAELFYGHCTHMYKPKR